MKYPCFVWRQGLRGPKPEIWYYEQRDANQKILPVLAWYPLTTGEAVSATLAYLTSTYPAPKQEENKDAAVNPTST